MTPWGAPYQPTSTFQQWVDQYCVWLLIGGLVVLAVATNEHHGKGK